MPVASYPDSGVTAYILNDDYDSEFAVEIAFGTADAISGGGDFDESAWGTAKWETNSPEDAYWQPGDYSWHEITAWVESVRSQRGRQSFNETFPAGTAVIRVQNYEGEWSTAGGISGVADVEVGMGIRWRITSTTMWSGYISEIRELYDQYGNAVVDFLCEDGLAKLAAFNFPDVDTYLWTFGTDPGDAMALVYDAAGWPAGSTYRVFNTPYSHTVERFNVRGLNALDVAQEIAAAEGGALIVDNDGALEFQNRSWLTSGIGTSSDYDIESDGSGDQDIRFLDPVIRSNRRVINAVTYYRKSRPDDIGRSDFDAESIQKYGRRETQFEVIAANNTQLEFLADRLIEYRAFPQRELPSVGLRPVSDGDTFLSERSLEFGDVVSVNYEHPKEAWSWNIDNHLVGLADEIDRIGKWTRTLFLDSTYMEQGEVGG